MRSESWRVLVPFVRGVRGPGRSSVHQRLFVCVIMCLPVVARQRTGAIKSPVKLNVLPWLYLSCEQLLC